MDKDNNQKDIFKQNDSVDLVKYIFRDADMPEPIEKVNRQTVSNRVYWGEDNLYPQFLNRLYYENPVHGGVINQKVKFITAGGLSVEGGEISILDNNGSSYTIQEVVDSVCRDFEIGETQCWHFKKDKLTGSWFVESMDYELIRVTENEVYFDYSDDWSVRNQTSKQGYRRIKNIHYITEEDNECLMRVVTSPKQRSFVDEKSLTANYYPCVNYSGAITDILSGIEMAFFTYSEVMNGWKGGTLVNMANGRPQTDEARKKVERDLKLSGTKRTTQGGFAITYSDGKDRAPEVMQMNGNDLDKRYEQAKKTSRDNIMVAHGVISPSLFGIFTESMFGSKEEMEISYILFKENYVETRQRQLIDPLNWALSKLNGFTGKISFDDYIPSFLKVKEVTEPKPVQMSEELDDSSRVIAEFSKCGVSKSSRKICYSKSYENYENNEEEFKKEYVKSNFAVELTDNQKVIITMIKDGESYNAIKNALDITGVELSKEIRNLGSMNLLDGWEVTDQGSELTVSEAELTVMYSYELRSNAPPLVSGGKSRPFCETLINLDRLYTRQEIDTISSNMGRDVWRYRGGWYHNPNSGKNTPSCRHTWMQNITVDL